MCTVLYFSKKMSKVFIEKLIIGDFTSPTQPLHTTTRSYVTTRSCPRSGGAEAEQDGCVLGTGELRAKGWKSLQFK